MKFGKILGIAIFMFSMVTYADSTEPIIGKIVPNPGKSDCPLIVKDGDEKICAKLDFVDDWLQQSVGRSFAKYEQLILFGEFEKRGKKHSDFIFVIKYVSAATD